MSSDDHEYPDVLLNISPTTGEAPETRLEDADDARRLVEQMLIEDQPRSIQRALVNANLKNFPPYGGRKPRGSAWEADINFGMGAARLERAAGAYTGLFAGVENYADIQTGFQPDNPDNPKWSLELSRGFHDLIKTWGKGFDYNMQHRIRQMLSEGFGPVLMEQGDNWRFRALDASAIKVPKDTLSVMDERCRYVCVLEQMSVIDLYRKTLVPDDPRWNQESIKWAITSAGRSDQTFDTRAYNWEWWQKRLQHHDLRTGDVDCDMVACAHLFVNEFGKDGEPNSISHFIFTRNLLSAGNDKNVSGQNDFLFKHIRAYDSYDQLIHVFFEGIGDGKFHSVRGLAFKTFKQDVIKNRLLCRTIDRAYVDSTAWIASETQNNSDKLDNITVGSAVVRLPAGAKMVQTGFAGQTQGVMDCIRLVSNITDSNTGASNPRTIMREDGKGEQPTLGQVRAQIAQDTQLSNDQMRIDYLAMDRLYTEMAKRAFKKGTKDKEAQKMQERLLALGVPQEAMDAIDSVMANRSAGYGSSAMKDAVMEKLMQVVGMLPEDGKDAFLNMFIMSATENPAMVNLLNPKQHMPTPDDALIVLENSAIKNGEEPVIYSGQDNVRHLQGHLADVEQTLGPIQQAMEAGQSDAAQLQEGYAYLQVMGPHLEAHLAPLRMDPSRKQLAALFEDQVAQLTAFHGKMRQAIRTAIRDQQIQQQQSEQATALDAVTQAKLRSAAVHDQIAVQKAQTSMALKTLTTVSNVRQSAFKTAHTSLLDTATTAHDIRMDKAKKKAA